jgi:hypothetical protein
MAAQLNQLGAGRDAQQRQSVLAFGAGELDNDTLEYGNSDEKI